MFLLLCITASHLLLLRLQQSYQLESSKWTACHIHAASVHYQAGADD